MKGGLPTSWVCVGGGVCVTYIAFFQPRWCYRGVDLIGACMLGALFFPPVEKRLCRFKIPPNLPGLQMIPRHIDIYICCSRPMLLFRRHATGNLSAGAPRELLPFPRINERWQKNSTATPNLRQPSRKLFDDAFIVQETWKRHRRRFSYSTPKRLLDSPPASGRI